MITEQGIVTKIHTTTAWVRTIKTSACKACSARDTCHTLGGGKEMEVEAINDARARVGDNVVVGFESVPLLKVSFLIYIFPIFCMIAGAVVGQKLAPVWQFDESVLSVIMAFCFFFFAFLIVRITGKKLAENTKYRARIIRISRIPKTTETETEGDDS